MLHQDQEIFNVLLEAVSEGVVILDHQQRIMEVNDMAETIFGYNKGELLHKELKDLIPPHFYNNYKTYFEAILKNGKKRKLGNASAVYGEKKNGQLISMKLGLNPFVVYGKSYILVLINDITENIEIEKDLMLKSSALALASSGIVITDALKKDNPIIYFNDAFQKLTGYSSEEILGRNCRFLQGDDRNQPSFKIVRDAIKYGESCQVTVRNYKKDGSLFWSDLYIIPIINNDAIVTHFIGIQNDTTQQKKIESERNHFANIFRESLNEIYVVDAHTFKFIDANYGAQKNSGYTLDELLKKSPLDLKPLSKQSKSIKTLDRLLSKKDKKLTYETQHKRKDGSIYPVEVHIQPSKLNDDEVFIAIVIDITDRKNYTKQLEKKVEERTAQLKMALSKEKDLNELKTQFLSLVAHEFKTPLSGLLTSSVLVGKYKSAEDQFKRDKHINIIADKVQYLNTILNDFLSLEKLESGKATYNFRNFKLSKVLDEVIYNANMLLKEGQYIHYPDNVNDLSLFQDEKIIALMLTNLVNNAIKYSPENSKVSIQIKQGKKFTTIEVIDQGIGIPLKDQKSIFERYFRAENVLNINGTGIGLNIVKNNLENLGGSCSFKSRENEGSTFTITFPNTAKL